MDSNFLLPSIFWLLAFLVGFLLIVMGGIFAFMITSLFRQGAGGKIGGAGDTQPQSPKGGGDVPSTNTSDRLEALIEALSEIKKIEDFKDIKKNVESHEQ